MNQGHVCFTVRGPCSSTGLLPEKNEVNSKDRNRVERERRERERGEKEEREGEKRKGKREQREKRGRKRGEKGSGKREESEDTQLCAFSLKTSQYIKEKKLHKMM